MRRIAIFSLFVGAFCVPVPLVAKPHAPGAVHFDFGYFCAVETVETLEAEDTMSGVVNLVDGPPPFIKQSTVVPGRIGIGFGIHIDVEPGYAGEVTVVTLHPPMGENGVTRESWSTNFTPGDISYNGFTFEYDYELVFGPWNLSASRNGRVVYEVDFLVVDPSNLPPVACGRALMS